MALRALTLDDKAEPRATPLDPLVVIALVMLAAITATGVLFAVLISGLGA